MGSKVGFWQQSAKGNEILSLGFQNSKKDKNNLSGNPSVNACIEEVIFPCPHTEKLMPLSKWDDPRGETFIHDVIRQCK